MVKIGTPGRGGGGAGISKPKSGVGAGGGSYYAPLLYLKKALDNKEFRVYSGKIEEYLLPSLPPPAPYFLVLPSLHSIFPLPPPHSPHSHL